MFEGNRKSDETLVFSNEIGEPLPHFHDTWVRTVLKAHGITPARESPARGVEARARLHVRTDGARAAWPNGADAANE
jgi:hypothetical protein